MRDFLEWLEALLGPANHDRALGRGDDRGRQTGRRRRRHGRDSQDSQQPWNTATRSDPGTSRRAATLEHHMFHRTKEA